MGGWRPLLDVQMFRCLSARLATGRSRFQLYRSLADLAAHLSDLIAQHTEATKLHLVMDCLNIHQSEAVVRLV
jgi:hypothetical protein